MANNNIKRKDHRAGKPLSPARRLELQEQIKAKLGNLSPTAFGLLRALEILDWIWRWGYTTREIAQKLSGSSKHGICNRLAKKGWLLETPTATGLPVSSFFTLTAEGLHEVENRAEKLHRYPYLEPQRVRQNLLKHNLAAQRFTLDALLGGQIKSFETDITSLDMSLPGIKQPDCTWIMVENEALNAEDNDLWAIEVEFTRKWDRDFDDFRSKVVRALTAKKFHAFHLVTDVRGIIKGYSEGMLPGTKISQHAKDKNKKWCIYGDPLIIPPFIGKGGPFDKFVCHLIKSK